MASVDTKPKKKRIAPQKEAELPIVSVPEDIIAAQRLDDLPVKIPSTAGIAKGGIKINIRSNPMVNVEQALEESGLTWFATKQRAGVAGCRRTQVDVVKRVLDRQTRLFQVREAVNETESELSESVSDEDSSEMDVSEEEDSPENPQHDKEAASNEAGEKPEDVEVELDAEQEEEWGLKNIGDYDLDDDFIDDSEFMMYFENIKKRPKYSGFYIHKGPLKMMERTVDPKSKNIIKKSRTNGTPNGQSNQQTKQRTPSNKAPPNPLPCSDLFGTEEDIPRTTSQQGSQTPIIPYNFISDFWYCRFLILASRML